MEGRRTMSENRKIAEEIVKAVGGDENILSVAHCATRLRIMVKDKEAIDQEAVEATDKVKGAFFNSGQYQVIFGTGTVNRVYEEVMNLGLKGSTKSEQSSEVAKSGSAFQRAIRTFGDVFVPIIPALVATGLFMGLRGLVLQEQILALFGMTPDDISQNFILFTEILTDTAFIFLPALVAWSTFRVPRIWRFANRRAGTRPHAREPIAAERMGSSRRRCTSHRILRVHPGRRLSGIGPSGVHRGDPRCEA